jgi:hypothetical protein
LKAYDLFNAKLINSSEFSQSEIDLICFFIGANFSVRQIDNEFFSNLMRKVLHKLSPYQFRTNFLPDVYKKLKEIIQFELRRSKFICLTVDLWKSRSSKNFIGAGAILTQINLTKLLVILAIDELANESIRTEVVKGAIEAIVNDFELDKRKINGIVCDQGSNSVRLFGQLPNEEITACLYFKKDDWPVENTC